MVAVNVRQGWIITAKVAAAGADNSTDEGRYSRRIIPNLPKTCRRAGLWQTFLSTHRETTKWHRIHLCWSGEESGDTDLT